MSTAMTSIQTLHSDDQKVKTKYIEEIYLPSHELNAT